MNVALLEDRPFQMRNLFEFVLRKYLDNSLTETSKIREIKSKVEEFAMQSSINELDSSEKVKLKKQIQNFSFYDANNYTEDTVKNEELYKLMAALSKFKEELVKDLSENKVKRINFGTLERKVSPPLEAYEYVGNNKEEILQSDKSYGLLFE